MGDGIITTASALLVVISTENPLWVAGLYAMQQVPWVLLALPSGALVDRTDRNRLMVLACWSRAIGLAVLGVAVVAHHSPLGLLYAISFADGAAAVVFDNVSTTVVPDVVSRDDLESANGGLQVASTVSRSLLAAPLAGLLFAWATGSPFLVGAAFAAVGALACSRMARFPAVTEARTVSVRAAVTEGLRWLRAHDLLWRLAAVVTLSNVMLGAVMSVAVIVARERLGLGPVGYGLLMASAAVGGIVGGLSASAIIRAIGTGTTLRVGLCIEAGSYVGLALTRNPFVAALVFAAMGVHLVAFSTVTTSVRQLLTPTELLGRVHSAYRMVSNVGMLVGALVGGLAVRFVGLTAPFWLGAVVVAAVAARVWPSLSDEKVDGARRAVSTG